MEKDFEMSVSVVEVTDTKASTKNEETSISNNQNKSNSKIDNNPQSLFFYDDVLRLSK